MRPGKCNPLHAGQLSEKCNSQIAELAAMAMAATPMDINCDNSAQASRLDAPGQQSSATNALDQHRVAHVRYIEGDDHLRLQLRIQNDRKTFFRPVSEKWDKLKYRLQILAAAAAANGEDVSGGMGDCRTNAMGHVKNKKGRGKTKKKKNSKPQDTPETETTASESMQSLTIATPHERAQTKVSVRFFNADGLEFLSKNLAIGDVLMQTARIEIGGASYVVLRNQPLVLKLSVLEPVLAGIPVVPIPETEFCHPDECSWKWFRIAPNGQEVPCGSTRRYVPSNDDIGCRFRIECHAPSMHSVYADESKTEVITTQVVRGPNREVFQKRQHLGRTRACDIQDEGSTAFRVMSYNILFDGYTTTDHAQQNLFPYASATIMNEMYRMQLVFQEIEECNSDIICLQEMGEATYNSFFAPMMKPIGFHTFYSGKTGTTHEGCAVFVRNDAFDVVDECTVDLGMTIKHSPDPTIKALLAEFPEIAKGFDKIPSVAQVLLLRSSLDPTKHLVLSNTHLFYREDAHLIRLLQTVAVVREVSKIRLDVGGHVGLLLCGDYNSFPDTAPVHFLLNGSIDSTHRHWQEAPQFKWNRTVSKTGNENSKDHPSNHRVSCGRFEHYLSLESACGVPAFTNFAGTFVGTLDYIMAGNECLGVKQVFPSFTAEEAASHMDAPQLLSLSISSDNFQENEGKADSNVSPARRSIRKNVLARGLARRYDDQKGREETLKSRISRQKKQLAILEEYNRRKEAESAKQDQVKKLQSSKTSPSRGVVPQKGLTNFLRNTSLRVLADNQAEERGDKDGNHFDEDLNSPTEEDLERFAALTSKTDPSDIARVSSPNKILGSQQSTRDSGSGSVSKGKGERSNGSSSIDKSSAQVLCELRATKEIVVREQTLKQLHQLVPAINTLAEEISAIIQKKAAAAAILTTATFSRLRDKRASSSLTVAPLSTGRPESGQADVAVAERDMKELSTQLAELSDKLKHRVKQFQTLIGALQEASMNAAEAIIEWRHFRTRRCRFTNFQPLYRFPWKKMRVLNYLTHMDADLHFLFQTAMLRVVMGPDVTYNPLLLPRGQLASLGFVESNFVSTTFLTERRSDDETTTSTSPGSSSSPHASAVTPIPPHKLAQHYEALLAAIKSESGNVIQPLVVNGDRARRYLEILQQEKELETAEAEKVEFEKQRIADAYNPFASIKAIGGVEETLTQLLTAQSPHLAALSQQLRHRQEDTTRAADGPGQTAPDHQQAPSLKVPREPSEQLRVNSRRLRRILEKRKEQTVSTTECEMCSVQTWGTKNKLPGQLVVRKMTVKRQQNQYARRIQLQFRVHRLRRNILQNLTLFIAETRQSAVHIQRIFRGYCAKKDYDITKMLLEAERQRQEAVRKICHAYRRYKRRLRHRRSMTVESIAQAQLFNIQYQKLQEEGEDAVDRYRRIGEERRRQRVVLLQKRRLEQLELEQKRNASAIKIQTVVRGHLAKCELSNLRKEKKSHLTAVCIMTLQSNVRRFLKRQEARRLRFRQDLERVNRSAVRIQSIYRGYNSRASLLVQLDETMKDSLGHASQRIHNDTRDDDLDEQEGEEEEGDDDTDRLPPLRLSRPSSSCDNEGSTHEGLHAIIAMLSSPSSSSKAISDHNAARLTLPPLRSSVVVVPNTPTNRRPSFTRQPSSPHSVQSMTRVELKLKEPLIGDDFERGGGSMSARRDSSEAKRSRGGRIS